ncbi:MAG: hypothetical protein WBH31_17155 [Promethearchaeia archaeon]
MSRLSLLSIISEPSSNLPRKPNASAISIEASRDWRRFPSLLLS